MKRVQLIIGAALVGLVAAMALLSLVWTPFDALYGTAGPRLSPPGWPTLLGTDRLGRDVFSRLLVGARSVLFVGVIAVGVATVLGVPFDLDRDWLERREQYRVGGHIVDTTSIAASALGDEAGRWTTVVTAAVLL